jgi:tetratricopeptide (TPR) repeat protein
MAADTGKHTWVFPSRFRARSYGWRSSRLACQRVREAVSEIKKVARKDPILGAEGAIKLMEKLWPALEHIDTSSGAMGTAVNKALDVLAPVVIEAKPDAKTKAKWLDHLWTAIQEDGVSYLSPVTERWGEVCGTPEVASQWASELLPLVRYEWIEHRGSYFAGTTACLSCLLAAGRHEELLDLLTHAPFISWHYRVYGVRALVAMGRKAEAIRYAQNSHGLNDSPTAIAQACEEILRSSGLDGEAYERYSLAATEASPGLATFRSLAKRYPDKDPKELLMGLIANSTPGQKGKWFATARRLGMLDLALELVLKSPADPRTINRAARDLLQSQPNFALGYALASLFWMAQGYGYDISRIEADTAASYALSAAEMLGVVNQAKEDLRAIGAKDLSMNKIVQRAVAKHLDEDFEKLEIRST